MIVLEKKIRKLYNTFEGRKNMGLKIEKVSKTYGNKKVVDSISFSMEKPGVYGLLGANGAGKTTTMRMILNVIEKDEGEITWMRR